MVSPWYPPDTMKPEGYFTSAIASQKSTINLHSNHMKLSGGTLQNACLVSFKMVQNMKEKAQEPASDQKSPKSQDN